MMEVFAVATDLVILRHGDIQIEVEQSQITISIPVSNAIKEQNVIDLLVSAEENLEKVSPSDLIRDEVIQKIQKIIEAISDG